MGWEKKADEALRGRCDSFVLETNVHFPTDINLLWDAMRKVISLTARQMTEEMIKLYLEHHFEPGTVDAFKLESP